MSEACLADEIERAVTALADAIAADDDEATRRAQIAHALAAETGLTGDEAAQWVALILGPET